MPALFVIGARNADGQTARAAKAFAEGLSNNACEAEFFYLPTMRVERCRQCDDSGWGICRTEGRCIIDDDLAALVVRVSSAEAVVFATPVYFGDLSESLRAFLDRLRRTSMHEAGKAKCDGVRAVGICVAGGGGGGAPECCASLNKVLQRCGFDVVDLQPVRRQNLGAKLTQLRQAGQWLAQAPPRSG